MSEVCSNPTPETADLSTVVLNDDDLTMRRVKIAEPLPAVECPPWCRDGNGHLDRRIPEDDECTSEPREVKLSGYPLVDVGGEYVRDWIDVRLWRGHQEEAGHVHMSHDGNDDDLPTFDLELAKAEALQLAEALRELAEQLS